MIATAKHLQDSASVPAWHEGFLEMLPAIRRQARLAFRHLDPEAREEAVEEAVANALVAYVRLFERGKVELAYPSVLTLYAIRQISEGRRVGVELNVRDVSSEYCRLKKGLQLERLDRFDRETGEWLEVVVEDRHAGPAETAAARIDIGEWFRRLPRRVRRIAKTLASGERTGAVAKRYRISPARVSQIRKELAVSWRQFQGEPAAKRVIAGPAPAVPRRPSVGPPTEEPDPCVGQGLKESTNGASSGTTGVSSVCPVH